MDLRRNAIPAILLVLLSPVLFFAQNTATTGTVEPNLAEFKIPLEQPPGSIWNWNRVETPDNACEYLWQIAVPNGSGRYSFGFYLYKSPGSKPAHGNLQALFKAGQTSAFNEDAEGRGEMIRDAKVDLSVEGGRIVFRTKDAGLIHTIFAGHPETVTINTRALGSNFAVVKVEYQN